MKTIAFSFSFFFFNFEIEFSSKILEDHGGREGEKNSYKHRGRETNHKRLLHTENKLRVDGRGGGEGKMGDGQ